MVTLKLMHRFLTEPDKYLLYKFIFNFGLKGMNAIRKFQNRMKQNIYFPAFLFISVTNKCNLECKGCWSSNNNNDMNPEILDKIIKESKKKGISFFGILGGEPLLNKDLFKILKNHSDCYFLLFTNGTLLTKDFAMQIKKLKNVSPLISIEGNEIESDIRRGGKKVFLRTFQSLDICKKQRLVTGVATSVCKSNINDLINESFLDSLIKKNVHYVWYYIYRPVGPNPSPELKLSEQEILRLRRFIVEMRVKKPILIVDSYWDHKGNALCPAATGIGHHINTSGDIEPCPPIQAAKDKISLTKPLFSTFTKSEYLSEFKKLAVKTTRGCILMENPELLKQRLTELKAYDSSGRNQIFKEFESITPCFSHNIIGKEIPEKHWAYRFAKKFWFFGFGAYG